MGRGVGDYLQGSGPVFLATSSASSGAERVLQTGTGVETGHEEEGGLQADEERQGITLPLPSDGQPGRGRALATVGRGRLTVLPLEHAHLGKAPNPMGEKDFVGKSEDEPSEPTPNRPTAQLPGVAASPPHPHPSPPTVAS